MTGYWHSDLEDFIPVLDGGIGVSNAALVRRDDLFESVDDLRDHTLPLDKLADARTSDTPLAAFVIDNAIVLTVNRATTKPSFVQCLVLSLSGVAEAPRATTNLKLMPVVLDALREITIWLPEGDQARYLTKWNSLQRVQALSSLEIATVPKLYGNKSRLVEFVHGAFSCIAPEGATILDAMSGTGIVSRSLASTYRLFANDANLYASVLTQAQSIHLEPDHTSEILSQLREYFEENVIRLRAMIQQTLDREGMFLHDEYSSEALEDYAAFCNEPVMQMTGGSGSIPYRMITERYANAYFGVLQSVELDSLRYAIDKLPMSAEIKSICLAALLSAASNSSSGPHFAQPPVLRTKKSGVYKSLNAFRSLAEKRARSVQWEFELALTRLAERPSVSYPFASVTNSDWSVALDLYTAATGEGDRFAYLDPPYSKLQYSRYYHVLNTILDYDYPGVSGTGLYPAKEKRFSSRFEYQASTSRKEFESLFERAAASNVKLVLSYSDTGFVKLQDLLELGRRYYSRVDYLFEKVRHHSQGTLIATERKQITEYLVIMR